VVEVLVVVVAAVPVVPVTFNAAPGASPDVPDAFALAFL
jgi:hypothetical protein